MSDNESGKELLMHLGYYQDLLKTLSEDEFVQSPEDGGWSLSEVYCHIIQVNTRSLLAIEKCMHGKETSTLTSPPFFTRLILFFGKLPPGRHKSPANIGAIVKKQSKEEARNDLIKFIQRLTDVLPKIVKSTSRCQVKHPRLGMLNRSEWLRFMIIHTKHHIKQLKRIRSTQKTSAHAERVR